jgi:hypothetical protein
MHPRVRSLIKGFERDDPPPNRQKAVTPALLKDMYNLAQTMPRWAQHAGDLILGGYFFAMRACEFCLTERPGRTRRLTTANVVFRDKKSRLVKHDDPSLRSKAMFVTVCFVDQKNGTKMEKRSQRRSGIKTLCPVEAWVSVIARIQKEISPIRNVGTMPVCTYMDGGRMFEVESTQVLQLLRRTCAIYDGENKYGISEAEIGTRSIRSGAAMALALQGGNSDKKIMMLGRWKSAAFLDYIRPQVLEWAGDMSSEMAKTISFLDVGGQSASRSPARLSPQHPNNTPEGEFPIFTPFDSRSNG